MQAMLLERIVDLAHDPAPLIAAEMPLPEAAGQDILIEVTACGVCHTELDEIEGRTPPPRLPIILGHQVVGRVVARGPQVKTCRMGERVGVAWIHSACGQCAYCRQGQENLCPQFQATGRDVHGGYAQYMTVNEAFAHSIPENLSDIQAAPLLCAGAIGYRSLRLSGLRNGQHLGLTGFGASAHLVLKLVRHIYPDTPVFVFARSPAEQSFARELGAVWAGHTDAAPPQKLHAIIDTTPAWQPVIAALSRLAPGGRLVINAIRKEIGDRQAWLSLDYAEHLWQEKEIKSVANVTRQDVREFLETAARIPIHPEVQTYPLKAANAALLELKRRKIRGAKVLVVDR
ncbi:MAG: alcohol dehydrogenase [Desulfobacteraceae bacterium]|nr:MAG: alcohol dehydrogenase [Desulfobacteraceae bacterium]